MRMFMGIHPGIREVLEVEAVRKSKGCLPWVDGQTRARSLDAGWSTVAVRKL